MMKIYVKPRSEVIKIEYNGMLCASDVDGGFSDSPATENAKARFMEDWDEEGY